MRRRGDGRAEPVAPSGAGAEDAVGGGPSWWRSRGPLLAALGVQAVVAASLCILKLKANAELGPGERYPFVYNHLLATVDWAGAVWGLLFLSVAVVLPAQRRLDDLAEWLGRNDRLVAAVAAAALAVLCLRVQQNYPLTMDEHAPAFQAEAFARGRLAGQWPPPLVPLLVAPVNIGWFFVVSKETGQVCSEYWPGHALLMAPFAVVGAPWACNPVLSGCALLLVAALARRAFGDRAAGWAILFMLASPVFAAYGISFYAMTAHMTLNLLYALLLTNPTLARVAGAGAVGGFALALHNPFPHFAFALPWLGWLAVRPDRWTRLPLVGLCYAAVFLPIDVGWRHVKQAIRENRPASVFAAAWSPRVEDGAETGAAAAPGETGAPVKTSPAPPPPRGFVAAVADTIAHIKGFAMQFRLPALFNFIDRRFAAILREVAWDAPGLLVLACLSAWRHRRTVPARLMALSGLATFLGYSFIDVSGGHGWGQRYFFSAWSCLPFLAGGLLAEPAESGATQPRGEGGAGAGRDPGLADVLRSAGLAAVLSLVICLPVRLWQIHAFIADHVAQIPPLPEAGSPGVRDVVRFLDPFQGYFRNDLVRNHSFFEHGPYTFVSTGAENDKQVIERLAAGIGLRARLVFAGDQGTTWVLEEPPPQEKPR